MWIAKIFNDLYAACATSMCIKISTFTHIDFLFISQAPHTEKIPQQPSNDHRNTRNPVLDGKYQNKLRFASRAISGDLLQFFFTFWKIYTNLHK